MRRKFRVVSRLLWAAVFVMAWFAPPAQANEVVILNVPAPSDFYFTFQEPSVIQARAYGQEIGYDTHLWLYDSSDVLVAANDDYYGLDSWIEVSVEPGTYRLRAGICCGDPDGWNYWGESDTGYTIEFNSAPENAPETTTSTTSTTSTVPETTTTEPAPTTTTVPSFLGAPTNVSVSAQEDGLLVSWEAATDDTGVSPERYAISWSTGNAGWGVATGNVGDENALNTQILLGYSLFESTGGLDAEYSFTVRADNDTNAVYSQRSAPVVLLVSTPTTSTTTSTVVETTTTTETPTTTTMVTTTTVYIPPPVQEVPTWPPTTVFIPPTTTPTTTAPTTTVPATTVAPSTTISTSSLPPSTVPPTTSPPSSAPTTLAPATTVTTASPSSTSVKSGSVASTSVVTTEPVDVPTASSLAPTATIPIDEVLNNPTSEVLVSYINEVTPETLDELTDEEVTELIDAVASADLTDEEAEQVALALSEAPKEIKQQFQETVNIFDGQFDSYVPIDSKVPVKTRRVIIVATTAMFILPAPSPSRKVK